MSEHIELEAGHELDRALRTALMALGQVMERLGRSAQDAQRGQAASEQARARELEQVRRQLQQSAREPGSGQRESHSDAQHAARQEWLDERSAARAAYGGWTREGAVEGGDRVAASKAWSRAQEWSGQDPVARDAAAQLEERITDRFGADPAAILQSVEPGMELGAGAPAAGMSVSEAADLAAAHAPFYYDRGEGLGHVAADGMPSSDQQRALVDDMQGWFAQGQIPLDSRMQAWARHVGEGDMPREQLVQLWSETAGQRSYEELGAHVRSMNEQNMSTEQVAQVIAGVLPRAGEYGPLLERAAMSAASDEQVTQAYRAARLDVADQKPGTAVGHTTAADAVGQLDGELRRRWGNSPDAYLLDVVSDLRVAHTDARRRGENQANAERERPNLRQGNVPHADSPAPVASNEIQPERGVAPSKATTEGERAHRERSWAMARREFASSMPEGTTAAQTDQAWRGLNQREQFGRYWAAYDTQEARGDGVDVAALREASPAEVPALGQTPAPIVQASPERSGATQSATAAEITRGRTLELNEQAASWFQARMTPGSAGHEYVTGRVGQEVVDAGTYQFGYAPPGWRHLTQHLRANGASDQEIVAAGLGRVSSRGSVIDVFRDRATVAIRDVQGDVVGFVGRDLSHDPGAPKYLNTGATPAYRKGDHVFGLHEAVTNTTADKARMVRVEGPFDAIAVTAAGQGRIHGVAPLGTSLTDSQVEQLAEHARGGAIWLGNDADAAGTAATVQDYWRLAEHDLDARLVSWPAGTDPADLWSADPEFMRTTLASPDAAPSAGMVVVDAAIDADRDGLLDGDVDAFERVEYARMDVAQAMGNDLDRDFLTMHIDTRLAALREDEGEAAAQATEAQDTLGAPGLAPGSAQDELRSGGVEQPTEQEQTARARQQQDEGEEHELTLNEQQLRVPVYDRASEAGLHTLSEEDWEARTASAPGFSRSTDAMLNDPNRSQGRAAKPASPGDNVGRDRAKNFRK
ncbi:toprim domain-containing protein [Allobranchiibius huperziae]|uniref:DNA primase n=1 Tax=Allobranchiibius huperziae TaxID=1874116 RepID=A0A853DKN2_9MICO|nr:toprim domain-containing protein [Allobranchiibius huperziae]NYJ76499.1 DNA primase [Allobranchiibius huperziae]